MQQNVTVNRLAGAAVAFISFGMVLVGVMLLVQELYGYQAAARFMQIFTYSGFASIYLGWQWPGFFLAPFRAAWRVIRRPR